MCSISSETQKLLGKLERKDRRRRAAGAKSGSADAELDWLSLNGFDALVEAEVLRASAAKGQVGCMRVLSIRFVSRAPCGTSGVASFLVHACGALGPNLAERSGSVCRVCVKERLVALLTCTACLHRWHLLQQC